ncbi:MAG: dTMP kinase [Deltaproteobacteria bacterium GWC2_42_11]|nr:MAG: dTMP kinase [Deltaproteobacteria bacterium GWC2_42_11]
MGIFITFEGIEGCGKTTQVVLLKGYLEAKGYKVITTREPGGTELGEKIRQILLNSNSENITSWTEIFLYEACRAQIVKEIIKPALEHGRIVICDRYIDSTTAYQGYGKGLDLESVHRINSLASQGITPDLTFAIDLKPEVGLKRAWARINNIKTTEREDRFEREGIEFHKQVREGYLKMAEKEPERIKVVDGDRDIDSIHREICGIVAKKLETAKG